MDEQRRIERIKRLKALIAGQPEEELQTQFASAVAELAALEADAPEESETNERKESAGRDRKKTSGRNRGA